MGAYETFVEEIPPCSFHPDVPAEYDGKTKSGPWAYMCQACFVRVGVGLGLGRGQTLILLQGSAPVEPGHTTGEDSS